MTSAQQVIGGPKDLPSPAALEILRRERLLIDALDGGAWIFRVPNDEPDEVVRMRGYWPLVELLTKQYTPAALDRLGAVRILVGDETPRETLLIRQGINQSKRRYHIDPAHEIVIDPMPAGTAPEIAGLPGTPSAPRPVAVAGIQLPVTAPAWLLQALTIGDLRGNLPLVGSWLRTLVVGLSDLERVYEVLGKPVVFARIGELAREAGNTDLADRIANTLHDLGAKRPSPSKTGRGSLVLPPTLRDAPRTGTPWLDRFAELFGRGAKQLESAKVQPQRQGALSRVDILRIAREAKREDTYHSTTIEGYKVSRDEVDAVLRGTATSSGRSAEEVKRLMALKGYAIAFDKTLDLLPQRTAPMQLTEALIHDLNAALWLPSIDAGIVSAADLRTWRNRPAFIRKSLHVPPGPEKLPGLMTLFCRLVNELDVPPVRRAAMAHWAFETIHPYVDGNGRIGRLLMNLILGSDGWPWVTIVAEDRTEYFNALERAQVDEDFVPWGRFLNQRADRVWRGTAMGHSR
ncbi:MAG: Fic family protein [Gemmatimonadetes bacterium]|nr:Fic family protein [Gemmatimonadota bacterium]